MMQAIAQWLQLHLVDDFVDKCKLKEQLSLLTAHTTLLHIEQCRIVELTNSTTMRTFHIVGINLQHRLGEHTGCLCSTEVLVGFLRSSLLGTMTNQYSAGKSTTSLTIEHILIKLVAGTMTHLMIDERIVIYHLVLVGNHTTIAEALSSLAFEYEVEAVAGNTVMKGDDVMVYTAVCLLLDIHVADTAVLVMSLLQAIEVETGILAYKCLDNLSSEEVLVIGSMVAEEELGLSTLFHHDEHTTIHHQIYIRTKDIDDLYGTLYLYVLWNIDKQAILCEESIQCGDAIFIGFGNLSIVFPDEFRVFCSNLVQRIYDNTFWQLHLWQCLIIKSIVYNEVERSAQIRHIAAESLVWIYGDFQTVQVQAIIWLEDGAHICVLVSFYLSGREAQATEVLKRSIAHRIEHLSTVLLDYSRRRLIQV